MTQTKKSLVERLFMEQAGGLRAFFYRRVRKYSDAAELAQEVYLRMLRVPDMEGVRNPEAKMPANNPGSVPEDKLWIITAYILQKNGFPSGSTPLGAQAEGRVLLPPSGSQAASNK